MIKSHNASPMWLAKTATVGRYPSDDMMAGSGQMTVQTLSRVGKFSASVWFPTNDYDKIESLFKGIRGITELDVDTGADETTVSFDWKNPGT